jgi:general secretion pathway protein H
MAKAWNKPAARHGGFSLLELLIALFIVGLIVSVAGLSVSSGSRPYQIEAALNEFMDIAEYALDEAQMRGVDLGLSLQQDVDNGTTVFYYQWLERYERNRWRLARFDEDAFGERMVPFGIDVALEVEQGDINLQEDPEDEENQLRPLAIFYSSGETTPGIMTWAEPQTQEILWELEWDLIGRLSKRRRGEVDPEEEDAR